MLQDFPSIRKIHPALRKTHPASMKNHPSNRKVKSRQERWCPRSRVGMCRLEQPERESNNKSRRLVRRMYEENVQGKREGPRNRQLH